MVSGVGHETDTTLTDFVADHRCHTPTDAAQLVIPDRAALVALLERSLANLGRAVDQHFARRSERLEALSKRPALQRADKLLEPARARLARAAKSLIDAGEEELHWCKASLQLAATSLCSNSPRVQLKGSQDRVESSARGLFDHARGRLSTRKARLDIAARSLETTSPFAVLERGYSITRDASGRAIRSAGELNEGAELETVLASGRFGSTVTRVERAEEEA